MGVCTTVKALAEALRDAKAPKDPRQQLLIEILRLMPFYGEIRSLDAWEAAFQNAQATNQSSLVEDEVTQALEEIFELGRGNLYAAFQADRTERDLERVVAFLQSIEVTYSGPRDVRQW